MRTETSPTVTMARLLNKEKVSANTYMLAFDVGPDFARAAPGQFVHLSMANGLTLRRPFSVAGVPEARSVEIMVEVVGRGTESLVSAAVGSDVSVMGPLGNSFTVDGGDDGVILVAGGIGVAGVRLLAHELAAAGATATALIGARSRDRLLDRTLPQGPASRPARIRATTDDGSSGVRGVVTDLLEEELTDAGNPARIYCCGPRGMIEAVATIAKTRSIACEAAMEEVMACGVGACRGCVVMTTNGYRSVCKDGPVFDVSELVIEPVAHRDRQEPTA